MTHKNVMKDTLSSASTREAAGVGGLVSSRYPTPDLLGGGDTTERERIKIKELELKCEELRLENYKLVEGPGGVLELKRMLGNKEAHMEEVHATIHLEKTELLKKLEEQTRMLEAMEQELVMLRKNQDHYDKRF